MSREQAPALIFGPGLPPGGARGTLTVSALGIEVVAGEQARRTDVASVSLRSVGFGRPGVEISWRDGDQTWAAHILDHAAAKRLLALPALANSAQGRQFESARRRVHARRSVAWSVVAFVLLLPALLLLLLVLNANSIAGRIAGKIPVEQEMELGRQVFAAMRVGLKLRDEGPTHEAASSIVARLTQGSKYRYEVHVSEDSTLNAFAMPGGIVVVNTGLVAVTKRPEELAGVLAHEVQHVELRHSIRGMIKDLGLRGLWVLVTGDLGSTLAGRAALEFTSLKFSRDDESEADELGFDALVRAGIDPSGMPEFFETMSKEAGEAPVALLSTHPLSQVRKQELEERVAQLGRREFVPLAFGAWPPTAAPK